MNSKSRLEGLALTGKARVLVAAPGPPGPRPEPTRLTPSGYQRRDGQIGWSRIATRPVLGCCELPERMDMTLCSFLVPPVSLRRIFMQNKARCQVGTQMSKDRPIRLGSGLAGPPVARRAGRAYYMEAPLVEDARTTHRSIKHINRVGKRSWRFSRLRAARRNPTGPRKVERYNASRNQRTGCNMFIESRLLLRA